MNKSLGAHSAFEDYAFLGFAKPPVDLLAVNMSFGDVGKHTARNNIFTATSHPSNPLSYRMQTRNGPRASSNPTEHSFLSE